MPSSCSRNRNRTRRNRRSHGGGPADLSEAFADLKNGNAKPDAPQVPNQMGGRRNRRSHGGAPADLVDAFADLKGNAASASAPASAPPASGANGNQKGGRRKSHKSRKLSKGARAWTTAVTKLYREMKAKDKSVRFRDALVKASKLKKSGQL